ncbi:Magnesium-transporting ATPase, P-type 1 [Tolypocladium ophioglossoides CBS 100239]|uniref:Magnesium-transporting ATPase, P-type 1 n=1 Tax=Tolypocladium ophioglossoides (strain CBS 100239) TaxID=1163406 RepID=A0A0L0N5M9_TOLOC|nr:Magnesium-transporting ATPase, P-type 1 [Tolypocladium ophioglossoides CBS 100239]
MSSLASAVMARLPARLAGKRASSWPTTMSSNELPPSAPDASPEAVLTAFAMMPTDLALEHLQTHKGGLTDFEADTRRAIKGSNLLPTQKPPSWILTLLVAIPNPFNILLIFLAIINASVPDRDWAGVTVLLIMVVISVFVRFWQEYRSSVAVFRLQSSVTNNQKVRRQPPSVEALIGKVHDSVDKPIMEKELVPGDIVVLSPGSVVPADCLILEASFLRISQSTWTGENEPVAKVATSTGDKEATLLDLANIAFMGTSVISGNGLALVLRTGADVLIAGMAKELKKKREMNSFQRGIRNVSWMLIGFMCVMVPIVLGISGRTTGRWNDAALFSISVAVGLVPEMLPAIVNANLARGAYVLSKMKAIVKRLDSVQNLGAMSVLCSDKTGTLTKDEITLCQYLDYTGAENTSVLKLATVDASIQGSNGNNIDLAILNHRLQDGEPVSVAQYEKVMAIPFTFERRRSACVVRGATGQNLLITKGAFDEVLGLCSSVRQAGVAVPLDPEKEKMLMDRADTLSREGYRVLLVAEKQLAKVDLDDEDGLHEMETRMTLEGLLSFIDPPKDDAAESIAQLKALGVDVKVLTGDSLPVALNVCQALGVLGPNDDTDDDLQAITGPDLALLEDDEGGFDAVVKTCTVFAKLTPNQKALVVASLRKAGHCVGMLGDGINDCMALRKADVGISVDSGASVAKDCADLILTEKGLGIIVSSVRTGRITHGNTIKYIKMVASSNFGNVFSVLAASAWLPFTPMLSLQILAQNLLYDVSQIAIPWDRVDPEYLQTPKCWNTLDLLRFVLVLGPTSSVIDMMTFSLGWFFYGVQTAGDDGAPTPAVKMFQAHWFLQGCTPHADAHRAPAANGQDPLLPEPLHGSARALDHGHHGDWLRGPVDPAVPGRAELRAAGAVVRRVPGGGAAAVLHRGAGGQDDLRPHLQGVAVSGGEVRYAEPGVQKFGRVVSLGVDRSVVGNGGWLGSEVQQLRGFRMAASTAAMD